MHTFMMSLYIHKLFDVELVHMLNTVKRCSNYFIILEKLRVCPRLHDVMIQEKKTSLINVEMETCLSHGNT